MKFDKIEEKFRTELNSRLIEPNENSWDRLDTMLTIAEEKKSRPKFLWMYVAATIVGLLLTVTLVFNQFNNRNFEPINNVVIEQKSSPIKKEGPTNSIDKIKPDDKILNEKLLASDTKSLKTKPENPSEIKSESTIEVASKEVKNSTETKGEVLIALNQKNTEVSVEELLASVQVTSIAEPKNSSIKVNAQNLLDQVDDVSTLTFKEKAIVTITENYKNIHTAIANRNQ
jgi:hypothetical protein